MYQFLLQTHSIFRWVALILLLLLIINSLTNSRKRNDFLPAHRRIALWTMTTFHLQLILGFGVYFISPKVIFSDQTMGNTLLRFFTLEHPLLMIISIALITIAYVKAKKRSDASSHKTLLIYSVIVLVILIAAIPWPFRESLGAGWI